MNHRDRIKYLQKELIEQGLCAALIIYSRDVIYYTGTAQPSYFLVLPDDYFLFVRRGLDFALDDVFIEKEKVGKERRLERVCAELSTRWEIQQGTIGIELDVLPANQLFEYQKIFSRYKFVDISPVVLEQRKTKDSTEIGKIRKACAAIDNGHQAVLSTLRAGVTELELAAAVENAHRLAGHEGVFSIRLPDFFMSRGPISSGANIAKFSGVVYSISGIGLSPAVPAGPSRRIIGKGDLVVVDIPTMVEGYHADLTRTYILGKADDSTKKMHDNLVEITDYLIEKIKPGVKCSEIYRLALEKSKSLETEHSFLSFGKDGICRMIGHGIGLEVNEPPTIADYDHSEISEGHVLGLELHMLDEHIGAMKLEDTILVGRKENELLTKSPRKLFEIVE